MTRIVLLAHGGLAQALRQSTIDIIGACPQLAALDLAVNHAVENYMERVRAVVKEEGQQPILFLADLYGGTPWRVAVAIVREEKAVGRLRILAGMNLAMVLEACTLATDNLTLDTLTEKVRTVGTTSIRD